jgi:uncharacterized protein YbjQ (UPF0145 family)
MKFNLAVLAVAIPVLLTATPAAARDDAINVFQVAPAVERPEFQNQTNGIRFYFAGQSHPGVVRRVQNDVTTSQRARKHGREAEEACQWAMMNALIRLRDAAQNAGANAVINIRSNWDNNAWSNGTEYQCAIGHLMAGVALKGDLVTLR